MKRDPWVHYWAVMAVRRGVLHVAAHRSAKTKPWRSDWAVCGADVRTTYREDRNYNAICVACRRWWEAQDVVVWASELRP